MAVSSYLRECGYELGGLLPKIYLIHKNALKLSFKAKGIEVSVSNNKDGDIYVLDGSMVQYKQEETYNGKYRFTSTLEITINEQYKEPFFYGLRTLRTNQYYIIIEDKKGIQYLINPELYTKMTYEYSFGDGEGAINNVVINYNNLSNYPLLIFNENISNSKSFFGSECVYNYGQAIELLLFDHKDLKIKDDGVKAESMYIEDVNMIKRVEYMKESLTLSEAYDGTGFTTTLSFSIPLDDKYGWAYRLLEFQDNKYSCIIQTTNDNYIIGGIERGLFPSFSVETSEEDSIPNIVNVKMEQRSQYPLLWTDELSQYRWTEVEPLCFGYDKYQMLVKEKSTDWGETWIRTDVKKKGNVICYDCEDCKEYIWEEDGTICGVLNETIIEWVNTDEFLCENGNKYHKTRQKIDGVLQEVYGLGELIEENSEDCRYIAVKWVDDGYNCYEINEDLNERGDKVGEECSGTTLMNKYNELVTHNGEDYFESGEFFYDEEIVNCCGCGYREEEWRFVEYVCGKDENVSALNEHTLYEKKQKHLICTDERESIDEPYSNWQYTVYEKECCECGWTGLTWVFNDEYICGSEIDDVGNLPITSVSGNWTREGNTFTSNKISNSQTTVQRINFTLSTPTDIVLEIDQSSEKNYDFLIISKVDKTVVNSTTSSNNFTHWSGKTTGSVTIPVTTSGEHFIELMYKKDGSQYSGRDNVIVTFKYIYDATSQYEIWREAYKCDVSNFTGNIEYRNGSKSCDCGYIDVIYKTEEGYVELTRRAHSDGVYIDTEVTGASDELYSYRANITYSGNSCLGDDIVWEMTSYVITQEYQEEVVDEIIKTPLIFTVTDTYGGIDAYFDAYGNVYNRTKNTPYWDEVLPEENGVMIRGLYSRYIYMPKYSVDTLTYSTSQSCSGQYTGEVTLYPYSGQSNTISLWGSGTKTLPADNTAKIWCRVPVDCSLTGKFYFTLIDDRLFDLNFTITYEVINDKRIVLKKVLDFIRYEYRNVVIPYDANDESTYIVENDERYYKVKEQFSFDGIEYYDYVNIIYFKGDKITD